MRDTLWALHQYFFYPILTLLLFVLLAYVVMSWLFMFNVLSPYGPRARQIYSMLQSVLDPLLAPIQRLVPPLGQLDLSVLLLGLMILFTRDFLLPKLILAIPV